MTLGMLPTYRPSSSNLVADGQTSTRQSLLSRTRPKHARTKTLAYMTVNSRHIVIIIGMGVQSFTVIISRLRGN